jgi:DNA-binding FrmR family transcriptional regulator
MDTKQGSDREIIVRLRRIEGQIRGIQRMLEDDRGCEQVLTQLMAARSSLDQVGLRLMESHIEDCVLEGIDAAPARLEEIKSTLRMWARFGLLPGAASPLDEGRED